MVSEKSQDDLFSPNEYFLKLGTPQPKTQTWIIFVLLPLLYIEQTPVYRGDASVPHL